jgi:hypothetical protein
MSEKRQALSAGREVRFFLDLGEQQGLGRSRRPVLLRMVVDKAAAGLRMTGNGDSKRVRSGLFPGGDWIRTSSTRAREVGCRAPTAAKSNGSTKPLSMRIGDLRSARTPHQGQEGKDIVVLDRWAEDRTEGAVSSLARSRPVSVL